MCTSTLLIGLIFPALSIAFSFILYDLESLNLDDDIVYFEFNIAALPTEE